MGVLGLRGNDEAPAKKAKKADTKASEVELCSIVKAANLFPGFRLHEEVGISGVSCDMVYEDGKRVFTVEAKMEFNFKVLAQACRWRSVATASYIAVPWSTMRDWWHSPKKVLLEELGLGIIAVGERAQFMSGYDPFERNEMYSTSPKLYQFPADMEYWKTCFERIGENQAAAGSKLGKRSTTFTRTIDALKLEAQKHPEYTLSQLLIEVPTHYSNITSAKSVLKRYAEHGVIEKFWKDDR